MRRLLNLLFLLLLAFTLTSSSFAQQKPNLMAEPESEIVMPEIQVTPPGGGVSGTGFLGQNHNYSVTFRGNGEAVVSLKAVFSNLTDSSLSQFTLRVPRVEPQDIFVYQVIKTGPCIQYRGQENVNDMSRFSPQGTQPEFNECILYQPADYYQEYYLSNKYQKATHQLSTDTIIITLPQAVQPNASGSYILYYRAPGYAKKDIAGGFDYTFESLKVEDRIQTLQVGITVDSDLYLKGVKGQVEYRSQYSAPQLQTEMSQKQGMIADQRFDTYYQQIGQGIITKTASNLQPLDSYTLKGRYANSRSKLYTKEIMIGILITLIFIGSIIVVIRHISRSLYRMSSQKGEKKLTNPYLSVIGISFITAMLVSGYTLALLFIFKLIERFSYSSYGRSEEFTFLIFVFLVLISVIVYILLIFGPAIFVGIKKGMRYGVATVLASIFWLACFFTITFMIFFIFAQSRSISPPYPQPLQYDDRAQ